MGYLDELLKGAERVKKEGGGEEKQEKGEEKKKVLVTAYDNVKIYKVEGEPLLLYEIPVISPEGPEKVLVNTIKEIATRVITVSPAEIRDPERRRKFYFKKVREIIENTPELGVPETKIDFYADMVVREMIGYGILDPLVRDDELEEIMVIGPNKPVYVFHRKYEMMKTNIVFANNEDINNLIDRVARQVNRRVDLENPLLDARLPDGSRVNATLAPISIDGSTITIRKFRKDPFSIIDLINFGTLSPEVGAFLWLAVDGMGAKPANIVVAGGTGSGKTTTLNVLAAFIPARERIITIEDTAELNLPLEHWVRFETRPPGLEGKGEITMDILVKNALRMRPDRIIVGEIRHAEAFTLFTAMNTGHDGCMGTVHSNSSQETLVRFMNPPMNVPPLMIKALDLIVMQMRIHDRKKGTIRRITEIAELTGMMGNTPQIQTIYEWDPATDKINRTGAPSYYIEELSKFTGLSKDEIMVEINKRREFLEDLAKKGIRRQDEVIREVRRFGQVG